MKRGERTTVGNLTMETSTLCISELYSDVHPATGYLVQKPKGAYGKRVKELVQYMSSLSVEMKTIRHSRQSNVHPCLRYMMAVLQLLSEMVFPVLFATGASYTYYQWDSSVSVGPLAVSDTEKTTKATKAIITVQSAGQWVGSTVRSIIGVPLAFLVHAVDRGLHVEEASQYIQTTGTKMFLLPVLFLGVYLLTKLLGRLILHVHTLCTSHRRLWFLQELLLKETEEALERAIAGIVKPYLISQYERSMTTRSCDVRPMDLSSLLNRISDDIKKIPFAELVKRGQLSALYAKTIHALIRHADEELSATMFAFHEEINRIPDRIHGFQQGLKHRVTEAAQTTALLLL
jgi:hypothetical protein